MSLDKPIRRDKPCGGVGFEGGRVVLVSQVSVRLTSQTIQTNFREKTPRHVSPATLTRTTEPDSGQLIITRGRFGITRKLSLLTVAWPRTVEHINGQTINPYPFLARLQFRTVDASCTHADLIRQIALSRGTVTSGDGFRTCFPDDSE